MLTNISVNDSLAQLQNYYDIKDQADHHHQPIIFVIVPMIFVFPSRSRMVSPSFTYQGRYLKVNLTCPLSSFLKICSAPQIQSNTTVCWMVPQCNTPSYFGLIVVELCKTCISASKVVTGYGLSWLSITTIPLRISFLTSFSLAFVALRHKHANYPEYASFLVTLLTWIDFTITLLKLESLSGPKRQALLLVTTPDFTTPETTNPTPSTKKFQFISNSKGCVIASSMLIVFSLSILQMNLVKFSNPNLLTLDTGKIGQIVPEGISSATLSCSFSAVFSVISMGNLLRSLCFNNFLSYYMVSMYLFSGARSILVKMMKKGILRKRQRPICSLVIF